MNTVLDIQRFKREGRRFAMLTAYDYLTASVLDGAGIPVLLVGDSLGMVMLGYDTTLPVTLDEMLHHCRAGARGAKEALLVGDLPFMSYEPSPEKAMEAAGRMLKEGGMHSVKLEGGAPVVETVRRLTESGVPVMAHLGLTPQKVHQFGGFKVQGRTPEAAARILADARKLEGAGAFSLVLEAVPTEVARTVTEALKIPTIGIGAGPHCDGQVLVFHDLAGPTPSVPKFVKRFGDLALDIERMARRYAEEVGEGRSPTLNTHTHPARPTEDFARYPRQPEHDLELLHSEHVDLVYMPAVEEMYPEDATTRVRVHELDELLEGAHRPGHFAGVATVVTKLFNASRPHRAYFGQKDAQQAALITRMNADLDTGIEIIVLPTVREPDGLALSSRNAYLSGEERSAATCLSRALRAANDLYLGGDRDPFRLRKAITDVLASEPLARHDYAEVVDPVRFTVPGRLAVLAVRIGRTRLIDNHRLGEPFD